MVTWKNAVPAASEQFDRKREMLIREAAASFNRSGYHGTSLTEIAKKLGVTKAALYTYVPSKEDLLYHCHNAAMDTALSIVEKAQHLDISGREKLVTVLREYLEMMLATEGSYVVLLEEQAMKPVHMRAIIKRRDQFEQTMRDFVTEGIEDGSIVACNAKLTIFIATGALNWSRKWYRPGGPWNGKEIAFSMTQMLERAISSDPCQALITDPARIDKPLNAKELAPTTKKKIQSKPARKSGKNVIVQ